VANPILLAGGSIGYGEALHAGLATAQLGGVVVGPLVQQSRAGAPLPRLAETNGGFVLETGLQNRGLNATLKNFAKLWPRLGCPVIVQVADSQPQVLARTLSQLSLVAGVSGIELLLPRNADAGQTRELVRAAERSCDLPLWVKLPLEQAILLAALAVEAGAVGLVVGQAPLGAAGYGASLVTGALFGPLSFAPMLAALISVAALGLPAALIACGGIHTLAQAQQALAAGAQALQLDSAIWVEPGLAEKMVNNEW
jgi:dihydroorotate dehydrogenase (NAD+) catalytic subunit